MKAFLKRSFLIPLAMLAAQASAQDAPWRAVSNSNSGSSISLGRPQAKAEQPADLPAFRPASGRANPLIRAQAGDEIPVPVSATSLIPTSLAQGKSASPPPPIKPALEGLKPMPKDVDFVAPAPQPLVTPPALQTAPPVQGTVSGNYYSHQNLWGSIGGPPLTNLPVNGAPIGVGFGPDCGLGVADCGTCASGACETGCGGCGPNGCWNRRWWVGADYLMWFTRAQTVPPLLTTSIRNPTTPTAGSLGNGLDAGNTQILINNVDDGLRNGGRFYGGFWFPRCNNWGVDASFFFLGRDDQTQTFASNGLPILARPIIINGAENVLYVAGTVANGLPFDIAGSLTVNSYSELWGYDINLRRKLCSGCNWCLDLLGGFRHIRLNEGIEIIDIEQGGNPNLVREVRDSFRTSNTFNGGQLGLASEWHFCNRWSLMGLLKVGFGNMNQVVNISGSSNFQVAGAPIAGNAGILALASNSGRFERSEFTVVPEVGLKLGWDVTNHLRLHIGYDFLYLSNVVRPGPQIDRNINPAMLPNIANPNPAIANPAVPAVLFRTSDYWAQGMNFGMLYHW